MLQSRLYLNVLRFLEMAVVLAIVGCQNSSPCPDLGNSCLADQETFNGPAVSIACECSLTDGMLGALIDISVTDEIWAQEMEKLGGVVKCVDKDEFFNITVPAMGPAHKLRHVQLPPGACCGEWIQKLKTTFGEQLALVGPSPCGDSEMRYPWGTTYAH